MNSILFDFYVQAKDAEKAKLKGAGMRRTSNLQAGTRHSRRGTSTLSKRRESFSPKTSPGPSRGSSATPEINLAPNSSKGSAKRLSNRIEEVLERTSSALKMTKLPPINQKKKKHQNGCCKKQSCKETPGKSRYVRVWTVTVSQSFWIKKKTN